MKGMDLCNFLGVDDWVPAKKHQSHGTIAEHLRIYLPAKANMTSWKVSIFNRSYIFKLFIFHCYVSFQGVYRKIFFSLALRAAAPVWQAGEKETEMRT